MGPVATARLAEVARLREVVVVVVAELGVERIAPGTLQGLLILVVVLSQPPVSTASASAKEPASTDRMYLLHFVENCPIAPNLGRNTRPNFLSWRNTIKKEK